MQEQESPNPSSATMDVTPTDEDWGELGRRLRFLRQMEIFRGAARELLLSVAATLKVADVVAGSIVCREGERADQFFLIEAGTLAVTTDVGGRSRDVARLGPGQFFGEIALLGEGRRTATVRAETAARLWCLSDSDFKELLSREPHLDSIIQSTARAREIALGRSVFEVEHRNLAALAQGRDHITIGRSADNDLMFTSRLVSRHHAVLERHGDVFHLRDLGSANGTAVDGVRINQEEIDDGSEIWVGDERFIFDRREIQQCVEPRGLRVDVTGLSKEAKGGKKILHEVSLSALPGEFVAVVGGSGTGKTTLLDAMSGVRPATSGRVLYNGRDYYRSIELYRNVLGYVPQDDIIHTELPVRRTLEHAARLRLPADTSKEEMASAVDQALEQLSLTAQAGLKVKVLSGGQRKRASIGVELLTEPRIFFLDEPTSGLDPATDAQMMRLLRSLADRGSTVVLTTHATRNVALCGKIIVLARGGYLAFVGTPRRALQYFETEAFDEIYDRLANEATPEDWAQRFLDSEDYAAVLADQPSADGAGASPSGQVGLGSSGRSGGLGRQWRQLRVLSGRNLDLVTQNPASIPSLIMPPIAFTLLLLALFHSGIFAANASSPTSALQLNFLLSFSFFLFGLLFGIQEIIKELAIFRRERMVNLGILPYVFSKTTFLALLLLLLAIFQLVALRLFDRLPNSGLDVYGRLLVTLTLTGFAGLAVSLMTSSFVATSQQATDLLFIWIMPQVLFAGSLLPVPAMNVVGRFFARLCAVRWSFEALGQTTNLNELFASSRSPIGQAQLLQYGDSFSRDPVQNWLILVVFIVIPFVLTCLILKKRSTAS